MAVVEVQDYGVGIDSAEIARTFTSSYQSVGAQGAGFGLGLGLYIAKSIVE